jgi:hypothetical protein
MTGCNNRFVLPTFASAVLKTKAGKSNSKVSSLWSGLFVDILDKFEAMNTRVNAKLSSHCNRGGSNQVVVETPGLSLAAVFRTGWANRERDTLWEYISDSFVLSKQAGKALSKWMHWIGDVIYGGQPPIFDDIGGYHSEPASDPYYEDDPWMNPRLTREGVAANTLPDGNRDKLRKFPMPLRR